TPALIEKARVGADKVRALQSAAAVVHDVDDAVRAVAEALAEPARLSNERRELALTSFHRPGGATRRAVECIYDLLELPAPEAVPVSCALTVPRTTHHV